MIPFAKEGHIGKHCMDPVTTTGVVSIATEASAIGKTLEDADMAAAFVADKGRTRVPSFGSVRHELTATGEEVLASVPLVLRQRIGCVLPGIAAAS